jgi:hypothetical protein
LHVPEESPQLDYAHRKPQPVIDVPPAAPDPADLVEVRSFQHYRRLAEERRDTNFVEIGTPGKLRRLWRLLAWGLGLVLTAGLFTFLFYYFTNNFRIALIIVTGMLLYMFFAARLAEGRIGRHRD